MRFSLPASRHPTRAVFVDDSASFLDGLAFRMPPARPIKCFTDATEALAWIAGALPQAAGREYADGRTLPCDARRFDVPAVVVVDYAMPDMDGLAFCRALSGLPCKKILFTGEADERVAVDAFNRGLIDRYLQKHDIDATGLLMRDIAALELDYFRAAGGKGEGRNACLAFLDDPAVARLVEDLCVRHGFIEHHAFSAPDGLVLLDTAGQGRLLVIENDAGMRSHLEAAEAYEAPPELLAVLRARTAVPFFWQTGGMYHQGMEDWQSACRSARICQGRERWYWALFDLPEGWMRGSIAPFGEFLNRSMAKAA